MIGDFIEEADHGVLFLEPIHIYDQEVRSVYISVGADVLLISLWCKRH